MQHLGQKYYSRVSGQVFVDRIIFFCKLIFDQMNQEAIFTRIIVLCGAY
jgi:hypothetical protein